jgi:hypothetical protein
MAVNKTTKAHKMDRVTMKMNSCNILTAMQNRVQCMELIHKAQEKTK